MNDYLDVSREDYERRLGQLNFIVGYIASKLSKFTDKSYLDEIQEAEEKEREATEGMHQIIKQISEDR